MNPSLEEKLLQDLEKTNVLLQQSTEVTKKLYGLQLLQTVLLSGNVLVMDRMGQRCRSMLCEEAQRYLDEWEADQA